MEQKPRPTNIEFDLDHENLIDFQGNTVTNVGSTSTTDQLNRVNKGRAFASASSQYINTGFDPKRGDVTYNVWIKTTTTSRMDLAGCFDATSTNIVTPYIFNRASGEFEFTVRDAGATLRIKSTSTGFSDGNWHMMTCTMSGLSDTGMKLYMDGKQLTTSTVFSGTLSSSARMGLNLYYGTINFNNSPNGNYFNGDASDFKTWDVALSAEEIRQLYAQTAPNYHTIFDDCSYYLDMKKDFKDVQGNVSDGTGTGTSFTTDENGLSRGVTITRADGNGIAVTDTNHALSFLGGGSILMYIKPTDTANALSSFITKGVYTGAPNQYDFWFGRTTTTNLFMRISNGSSHILSANQGSLTWTNGTYYTVGFTWDGTTTSNKGILYRDGSSIGTFTSSATNASESYTNVLIGGDNVGGNVYEYGGDVITVLKWDRELSADEMAYVDNIIRKKAIYETPRQVTE